MFIALSACLAGILVAAAPEPESKGPFKNLEYRLIGPAASGRVSRVAGVPGNPCGHTAEEEKTIMESFLQI